ncbi:MAG TPA: hypothetical protein VE224_05880 [Pseudolabrys sp.]|nr:hypothetical protein [Pseudolabrys sp.]
MSRTSILLGFIAIVGVLATISAAPASAEFFGCNDRPGQLLYSYNGTPDAYISRRHRYGAPRSYSRSTSRDYRAPRHRRHVTYYGDMRYWNSR